MLSPLSNQPIRSPVLIGREQEIATLQSLLEQVRQGHGQVVLLSGEAGIGKSRLAAEVKTQAQAHGFLVLQGTCFPTDHAAPYAPLLDLFGSVQTQEVLSRSITNREPLARELVFFSPELVPFASDETRSPPPEPEAQKRRLFAALTQFFAGLAAKQPVFLTVEDVHWSDETSLEFLHQLARRAPHVPLLLVLTYRHDEIPTRLRHWLAQLDREHLAQEFVLAPLSKAEVEAMLAAIFAQPGLAPPAPLDALYELTEGNPFFVEELLKSLSTAEVMVSAPEPWERQPWAELRIPRSIQDTVEPRMERLSAAARQVVILAAVAGRRFDFALLQRITHSEEQELLALMKELIVEQLVVEASEEQFAFRHALTREAIYRRLLLRERKALHRTIAETMEQLFASALEAHLTELAYHFYEAGVWEPALTYAKLAGERAHVLYAPRAAIEQFTRALKAAHLMNSEPVAPLYRLRGQSYEILGEFEQARSDYERAFTAAQEAHDGRMQWQVVMNQGFLWAGREYERAGAFFRQAVQLAETLADPTLRAHSLNRLGNWLVNTGKNTEGLKAHHEALEVFQRQHDQAGMAQTFDLLGMTLAWSGDLVQGRQQHERAIALFRLLGDKKSLISTLPNASIGTSPAIAETLFVVVRSPEECERDALEAVHLARQMDWSAGEAYAEFTAGVLLASFGQFGQGLAHAHKGLQIAMEIEHQQWAVAAHCDLGHIYVLMLAPSLALHHLDAGLPLAETLGSAWWMGTLRAYQALAYLQTGQRKQAEAALQAVMPREQEPHTLTERRLVWVWGELALAQGEPQTALQITERLIASAPGELRTQPIPRLLNLKGEALVALKRLPEAIEALEEAKRGAMERREAPLLWHIHGSLGRVYRLLKREQEASNAVAAAREGIESLAQTIDDASLREQFEQRALACLPKAKPISMRRAEAEQFGGLTAREREVAVLIAQGKTSREIAERLVVSERTAEVHVSNILGKLGFTSRAQIAAWAVDKGLIRE